MKWEPDSRLRDQLRERLVAGSKPRRRWLVGIERERVVLQKEPLQPLDYAGDIGVKRLLTELAEKFGWNADYSENDLIALHRQQAQVTVEPACQIEFSTTPLTCIAQVYRELGQWEEELAKTSLHSKLVWLDIGCNPLYSSDQLHWIPKRRYEIMRGIMPKTGDLGLEMMSLTASTQVSIDYDSETDCEEKFRLAAALVPLFTALYANSPLRCGRRSGFVSYRSHIWTKTDPARCGIPPFLFHESVRARKPFFDAYIDFALGVPMYFLRRQRDESGRVELVEAVRPDGQGRYTYREYLAQARGPWDPELWYLHLSTLFTEVRLKDYLEIRTPDCNNLDLAVSFAAICKGILYHADARLEAWRMMSRFTPDDRLEAVRSAATGGLAQGKIGKFRLLELVGEMVRLAETALKDIDQQCDGKDVDFLRAVNEQILSKGKSPGEQLLELWDGPMRNDPQALIKFLSMTSAPISLSRRDKSAS